MKVLIATGLLMLSASAADAISVKTYRETKAEGGMKWEMTQTYLRGVVAGIQAASASLVAKKQPPLFCSPVTLTNENIVEIFEKSVKATQGLFKEEDQTAGEAILVYGVEKTFPCQQG